MRPCAYLVLSGFAVLVAAACVDKGPSGKKIDPAYVEANLLGSPPVSMMNEVGADLGGKVVYLGNDVDTTALAPGGRVTVVHYWRVVEPPGSAWRVFSHVSGARQQDWMNVDYTDMRAGHPPEKWKAGQIIRDEQKFALKEDWTSPFAELTVGLYRRGGGGISDRMPVESGPSVDSAVKAVRFTIDGKGAPAPGGYVIRRTDEPITIDGKADEPAWQRVPFGPDFSDAEGSPPMGLSTRAKMLYDDDNLYVFIQAEDTDVHSPYTEHGEPLWKADVVELFIDADKTGRGYVELQVNPNNAQFDAWFPQRRGGPTDTDWTAGMTSAVVVHGTTDVRDDTDRGWDVEIAIPLAAVKGRDEAMKVNIPPRVGDTWRLNVVRVELPRKGKLSASSWNPITYQDFHALDRMLTVTFGDAEGKTTPPPAEQAGEAETPADGETTAQEPAAPGQPPAPIRAIKRVDRVPAERAVVPPPVAPADPR
jgi:hypothetical protein